MKGERDRVLYKDCTRTATGLHRDVGDNDGR
jgi:hypothetical protein